MNVYSSVYSRSMHTMKKQQHLLEESMKRLSTGKRINSAKDDAAGLAMSERLLSKSRGKEMSFSNVEMGKSYLSAVDSAMGNSIDLLQRMRELSVQASNGTYNSRDLASLNKEYQHLIAELDNLNNGSHLNRIGLFTGLPGNAVGPASNASADIVFVLDDSASMAPLMTNVAANLNTFVSTLTSQGVTDFRIGVVQYQGNTYTMSTFASSSGNFSNVVSEVQNAIINAAASTPGSVERAMTAINYVMDNYAFRPNVPGAQLKNIILVTNEDADDDNLTGATISRLQSEGITVHSVYDPTDGSGAFPLSQELQDMTNQTGGVLMDINSSTWGDQLRFQVPAVIANNAGANNGLVPLKLHVDYGDDHILYIDRYNVGSVDLGINATSLTTQADSEDAISKLDAALFSLNDYRTSVGADLNRLEYIKNNLKEQTNAIEASNSRIMDANMAAESSEMVKSDILLNANYSMLNIFNKHRETQILSLYR